MNLLFLATSAFTLNRGGIERFSIVLGNRFVEDGHCVFYLSAFNDLGTNSEQVNIKNHLFLPDSECLSSIANCNYLCRIIIEKKINVIINNQADNIHWINLCDGARHKTGVKVVTILHFDPLHYIKIFNASGKDIFFSGLSCREKVGLWIRNSYFYKVKQQKLFGQVFTDAINKSDAFVVLSEHTKPRLFKMVGEVDNSKVYAISNPTSVMCLGKENTAKKKQLLFVGRMEFEAKRPDLLLQIWSRLYQDFPEWELIVVGGGNYLAIMKRQTEKRHLERIKFLGAVNSTESYQTASILCVTSNSEGFSLVTIEASQNYVVPVAFSSFPAVTDVIQDGITGYIVPPFEIDVYVNRLRHLMSHPETLTQMADQAHKYVRIFDLECIVPRWYKLFDSLQ